MRALNRAFVAIPAAHGFLRHRQFLEALAAQRELPIALGIGHEPQRILDRQSLGASAFALSAQAAIEGRMMFQMLRPAAYRRGAANGSAMAFRLSSNWSMSVMLGMVVETFGFFSAHFRAESRAPSRCSFSKLRIAPVSGYESRPPSPSSPTTPKLPTWRRLDGLLHAAIHGEVVGHQNDVENAFLRQPGQEFLSGLYAC